MADLVRKFFEVLVFLQHDAELLVVGSKDLCRFQVDRFDQVLDVPAQNRSGGAGEQVVRRVVREDELCVCWPLSSDLEQDVSRDKPALLLRRRLSCPLIEELDR